MDSTTVSKRIDEVYSQLFSHIEKRSLGVDDILTLASGAMEITQKIKRMTGAEKKEVVLAVILRAIDSKMVPKKIRQTCRDFVKIALPKVIDLLVSAYRHEINLKKITNCKCL